VNPSENFENQFCGGVLNDDGHKIIRGAEKPPRFADCLFFVSVFILLLRFFLFKAGLVLTNECTELGIVILFAV
jgi:hypothetical protein